MEARGLRSGSRLGCVKLVKTCKRLGRVWTCPSDTINFKLLIGGGPAGSPRAGPGPFGTFSKDFVLCSYYYFRVFRNRFDIGLRVRICVYFKEIGVCNFMGGLAELWRMSQMSHHIRKLLVCKYRTVKHVSGIWKTLSWAWSLFHLHRHRLHSLIVM